MLGFNRPRRIDPVVQDEPTECGLACVVMIANYWGHDVSLSAARLKAASSLRGSTLPQLLSTAQSFDLLSRPLRVEMTALAQLKVPAILHWDFNHFVVLEKCSRGRFVLCDPASGRMDVDHATMSSHFTGVAVELNPTQHFMPTRLRQRLPLRALLQSRQHLLGDVGGLAIAILAVEVCVLVSPLILRQMIDGAGAAVPSGADLPVLATALAAMVAISAILGLGRAALTLRVMNKLLIPGTAGVFHHLLHLPHRYFLSRRQGDIANRFESLAVVHSMLTTRMLEAAIDGLFGVILIVALAMLYPIAAAIVLASCGAALVVQRVATPSLSQMAKEALVAKSEQSTEFLETTRAMQTVQVLGLQPARAARFLNALVKTANARTREQVAVSALLQLQRAIFGLALLAIVAWACAAVHDMTTGTMLLMVTYATQCLLRTERFTGVLGDLRLIRVHVERVSDIVLSEREHNPESPRAVNTDQIGVELRDVWYRHSPHDPWVIKGLSMRIAPGESVAITGPSGSGKTTLVKILLGLVDPDRGEVLMNGVPLKDVGKDVLRRHSASVMQDDKLMFGTIAQNIAAFGDSERQKDIERCARMADIADDIARMPMKFHSLVSDGLGGLSGGQRQRLLLARALYRNPKLLVLDEATSHLDTRRESAINERIRDLAITRVIVAHRADTIRSADRCIDIHELQATGP